MIGSYSKMNGNNIKCPHGKTKRLIRRTSSFENPRQRQKDLLDKRVLTRLREAYCKANQDCTTTATVFEDEIDGLTSDDDESDKNESCYFGLELSLDFLKHCSIREDDSNENEKGYTSANEEIHYEAKMEYYRRMSFPIAVAVEEEIKQMFAMCINAGRWFTERVQVRSSTAQRYWNVKFFGEYMPIEVSDSGISVDVILFRRLDDDIVVFGVRENVQSEILYVTALENAAGALVLEKGDPPSTVGVGNYTSDLRFFHKIYDVNSGGIIIKPAFNSDLHLAIAQDMVSLVENMNNDFLQWEIEPK